MLPGVPQVIVVELITVTLEQILPPIDTTAPVKKLFPVTVIVVDPEVGPIFGETLTTSGNGLKVKPLKDPGWSSGFVAVTKILPELADSGEVQRISVELTN